MDYYKIRDELIRGRKKRINISTVKGDINDYLQKLDTDAVHLILLDSENRFRYVCYYGY